VFCISLHCTYLQVPALKNGGFPRTAPSHSPSCPADLSAVAPGEGGSSERRRKPLRRRNAPRYPRERPTASPSFTAFSGAKSASRCPATPPTSPPKRMVNLHHPTASVRPLRRFVSYRVAIGGAGNGHRATGPRVSVGEPAS